MKVKYNSQDDILLVTLNHKKIDYAEQSGSIIVHFSPEHEAVLLEILDAATFLKDTATQLPPKIRSAILAG